MGTPNIILLIADAMRANNLSCYGYERNTTPNLARIAEHGILFEQAYACSNHTDPSFTSIMTGEYPVQHGIIHHGEDVSSREINSFYTQNLAQWLQTRDYTTIAIDWLKGWHKLGFDQYNEPTQSSFKQKVKKYVPKQLKSMAREAATTIGVTDRPDAHTLTDYTLSQVNRNSNKKFFILTHYWDTHTPFDQLPDFYKNLWTSDDKGEPVCNILAKMDDHAPWTRAARDYHLRGVTHANQLVDYYDGGISFFDAEVGRLYDYLRRTRILDNTLLIITADHGDNLIRDNKFYGHLGLNENVTHVPLIMAGAGLKQGVRIPFYVQHNEIKPAIQKAIDCGSNPYLYEHDKVFTVDATAKLRISMRNGKYNLIWSPTRPDSKTKHDISWKAPVELYNLEKDPHELNNIQPNSKGNTVRNLELKLFKWLENRPGVKEDVRQMLETVRKTNR